MMIDASVYDDLSRGAQLGVLTVASTYNGALEQWMAEVVRARGPVQLLSPDEAVDVVGDEALACCVGIVGSLPAMHESPPQGDEPARVVRELEQLLGGRIGCIAPLNAAGLNASLPVVAAAMCDLPLLDCDGMGRVLPLIDQTTYVLGGVPLAPLVAIDPWGDIVTLRSPLGRSERLERSLLTGAGGWLLTALYPAPVAKLASAGIPGTVSRAVTAGAILGSGRGQLAAYLAHQLGGRLIGRGRVLDIAEHPDQGSSIEQPARPVTIRLSGPRPDSPEILLEVRNEVVLALVDGAVVGTTPDMICLLDPLRRRPVDLVDLDHGEVVDVLLLPADPRWLTPEGLALAGPAAFGIPWHYHAGGGR